MTIQDAFMGNPHIQRVFEDETFQDCTVHPSDAKIAARGIISALLLATVILHDGRPTQHFSREFVDEAIAHAKKARE